MFDDKFLDSLPKNPYEAAQAMCKKFFEWYSGYAEKGTGASIFYEEVVDAYAAMEVFINATGLPFSTVSIGENHDQNIKLIFKFFEQIRNELVKKIDNLIIVKAREKHAKRFGGIFLYEFSEGDHKRIQRLVDELRDAITESELFVAEHKQRILKKLESLQSELHKKMTSLDKLWGLIGEAGIALGKFGQDAKPLVDRIREIAQITWRTQARAEELPSGTTLPLLSDGKEEDD